MRGSGEEVGKKNLMCCSRDGKKVSRPVRQCGTAEHSVKPIPTIRLQIQLAITQETKKQIYA